MNPLDCEIISEQETSARILELREKILDENYINGAIQRIALILSQSLTFWWMPLVASMCIS